MPSRPLQLAEEALRSVLDETVDSVEHLNYFIRIALPKIVKSLLTRRDLSGNIRVHFNNYLIHIKEVSQVLCILTQPDQDFYQLSKRPDKEHYPKIMEKVREYFAKNEVVPAKDRELSWQSDFVYINPKGEPLSTHYLISVEYFGKRGGFDAIMDRLLDKENKPPLPIIELLLRAIVYTSKVLRRDFVKEYVPKVQQAIFHQLLEATQVEMKKDAKTSFKDISKSLKALLGLIMPPEEIDKVIEGFNLDAALMSLKSNVLERRLNGLKLIRKMIARATPKDDKKSSLAYFWNKTKQATAAVATAAVAPGYGGVAQGQDGEKKEVEEKPIDPNFVLSWLLDNEILKLLFTNTHVELIRQSLGILNFLVSKNKLAVEDLDMLWEASLGRHESEKRVIFETIVSLGQNLPYKTIDHIFSRIMETPINGYDAETVILVHDFTVIGVKANNSGKKNWYGMDVLWKLAMQEGEGIQDALATCAFDNLVELLKLELVAPVRTTYTERCAENLMKSVCMPQSLELLIKIVETNPKKGRKKVVDALARKYKLLDAFFADLQKYKREVHSAEESEDDGGKKKKKKKKNKGRVVLMRYPHMQQIKIRLSFLEFLLVNSSSTLTAAQVDVLWDNLITNALVPEEREACFAWLEKSSANKPDGFVAFDESVIQHLFVDKMAQMDCTLLNQAGFNVFHRYFLAINEKKDRLKRVDKATDELYVASPDLIGIDNLWQIALDAQDVEVSQAAIRTLNELHQNVSGESLKAKVGKIREAYIGVAMSHLSKEAATLKPDSPAPHGSQQRIQRCLTLLKTFVEDFDARGRKAAAVSAATSAASAAQAGAPPQAGGTVSGPSGTLVTRRGADMGPPISFYVKTDLKPSFTVHLRSRDTLGALKRKVSQIVERPPELLSVFIFETRELHDDDKTFYEYKIGDGYTIFVKLRERVGEVRKKPKKSKSADTKGKKPGGQSSVVQEEVNEGVPIDALIFEFLQMQLGALGLQTNRHMTVVSAPNAQPTTMMGSVANAIGMGTTSSSLSPNAAASSSTLTADKKKNSKSASSETLNKAKAENVHHPARILASEGNFDRLYDLLDYGNDIGRQVWELMNLLPTNQKILQQFRSADFDWDALFNPKHLYKLIYSLDVVGKLITPLDSDSVHIRHRYCAVLHSTVDVESIGRFVSLGGGKHLVRLFMSIENDPSNPGQRAVFASLLRIINAITLSGKEQEGSKAQVNLELFANVKLSEMVNKLLQVISSAAAESKQEPLEKEEPTESQRRDDPMSASATVEVGGAETVIATPSATLPSPRSPLDNSTALSSGEVVKHALDLLVTFVIAKVELLEQLYDYEKQDGWVERLLLAAPVRKIRQAAANDMLRLSQQVESEALQKLGAEPPAKHFLEALLSILPGITSYSATCQQYFSLLRGLLKNDKAGVDAQMAGKLLHDLLLQIRLAPVRESSGNGPVDEVIIGMLGIVRGLIRKYPELKSECTKDKGGLVGQVFEQCLFALPTAEEHGPTAPPKCKTAESRTAAFSLLTELAKDNEECFRELVALLNSQLNKVEPNGWWMVGGRLPRSKYGYVGLQNQGATCYMNSLMQQLFLIPRFRQGILLADDNSADKSDSLLYQMQVLFSNLMKSVKRYYDTIEFCAAYKDYDGKPVNTGQQMDANEFFNNLFAKLEDHLKGSEEEKLLSDVFGGELSNQLIPKECTHRSERLEPFYSLSIEIKNKKDIEESLKLFIAGEMLQGENKYKCEICQKGRDTLKRCCIAKLPRIMMLHLKRFEFDLEKMRNVKLNDRCEFPMSLNMEPYTKEYIGRQELDAANLRMSQDRDDDDVPRYPPEYYEYQLVGIVVHQGSADSGHYYSFIKERVPLEESREAAWFEFNDTNVIPFSADRIPYECFGGEEEVMVYDREKGTAKKAMRPKINNAYILVYERKDVDLNDWAKRQLEKEERKKGKRRNKAEPSESNEKDGNPNKAADQESDDEAAVGGVADNSGNESEDSRSEPFMTPSHSASSLVDIENAAAMMSPKGERDDKKEETRPESPENGPGTNGEEGNKHEGAATELVVAVSQEKPASPDAQPMPVQQVFSGGEMAKSPSFLALLFLGKLANVVKKKQREEELKRRREQQKRFRQGLSSSVIPEEIMNYVWEENRVFLTEKYAHDDDFLKFVWDVTHLYNGTENKGEPTMATVQFTTRFMIEIGSRTRTDTHMFDVWVQHLKRLYTDNHEACRWLLTMLSKDDDKFVSLLLHCPMERVRRAFASIILHAMHQLLPQERHLYPRYIAMQASDSDDEKGEEDKLGTPRKDKGKGKEKGDGDGVQDEESPAVLQFVEFLISLLKTVRRNLRHSAQYFNLLYDFVLTSLEEKKYFLARHIVREYIEFYLQTGKFAPVALRRGTKDEARRYRPTAGGQTSTASATKMNAPSLAGLVQTIAVLVRHTDPRNEKGSLPPTQYDPENVLELPNKDRDLLINSAFIIRLIKDGADPLATIDILKHYSWEDRKRSKMFLVDIKDVLNKASSEQLRLYFRIIKHLLLIQDSSQDWRIEYALVALHKSLGHSSITNKETVGACIKFIQKLSEKNDKVKAWLVKNKTISNEIVEHHQRLIQAEKEKEAAASGTGGSRSAFSLAKTLHK
ncbi:ubiquitin domain containing protein [Acanthamoeba castellanii str. Neff]|uniref:ubiquitinyl hydrolase 1 n=1 Tax=Acanthamoeba castellanii (strain ATCC 30010 / Neff) TaxID=1257118 RepID=L8GRS0_ACACF|nr:ubiquitin domain containing protein [Acanthamoeba castellanii str. Neff]ELR15597.1 ubiquitin domain containing protein [Acanthamoeba castellanii str. Neff]